MYELAVIVCGRICSGKSTFSERLVSLHDIDRISFGTFIRHYNTINDLPPTREALQQSGLQLMSAGHGVLLQLVLEYFKPARKQLLFEGVRHVKMLEEIKGISDKMLVVWMESSLSTRYKRYLRRESLTPDEMTSEEFRLIDEHDVELGTDALSQEATVRIDLERLDEGEAILRRLM